MTIKNKNFTSLIAMIATFTVLLTGCGTVSDVSSSDQIETTEEMTSSLMDQENSDSGLTLSPMSNLVSEDAVFSTDISNLFTERDLKTDYEITKTIVLDEITDPVLTLTQAGVYELTGSFNGQIYINTEEKIQLVLNQANISCSDGSAIYIENAKKVFITTAENSQNIISDGSSYADTSENAPNAAIYSKDSLTLNGTGTLTINGNYQQGIVSKDELVITGGMININAVGNGIKGKDSIAIYDGNINITAGGNGLQASNAEEEGKGFIYIHDGSFSIDAQQDGIQAESEIIIQNGSFEIKSGGGKENAQKKINNDFGGFGRRDQQNVNTDSETQTVSIKGIKAGSLLYISGGSLTLDTADDALHSNGDLYLSGGTFSIAAGDKGIHADKTVTIKNGSVNITDSYEGIEGKDIFISGGEVSIISSDDGFNASDGETDQSGMGTICDCSLVISGGYVCVDADGDGLDSNGSITISGGTVLVNGSTNDGNGALDSNNGITVSGGLLIAAGSSGMAEYPDEATQNVIVVTLDDYQEGGTLFTLTSDDGTELISYAPSKKYNSIIISTDGIATGKSYTVSTGGTSSTEQKNGLYEIGGYQNDGTQIGSVTQEESVCFIGTVRGMGGGMPGGGRGDQRPDNMQLPTDENGNAVFPDDFDPSKMQGNRGMKNRIHDKNESSDSSQDENLQAG